MTQALTPRQDGDRFQARLFWLNATQLLIPGSVIQRVGFENGPKAFDDVWISYEPGRAQRDQYGEPLLREHIQSKWHGSPGTYGYSDLVDPDFINANRRSLLERARAAQKTHAPNGAGVRFKLVTNWPVLPNDPLCDLVSNRTTALRVERLFEGVTTRSKFGRVRKLWCDHLDIDDEELRRFARTLGFGFAHASLDGLRSDLNTLFFMAGLKRVPESDSSFVYDDIAFQWMSQGRLEYDRATFRELCESEHLINHAPERVHTFGVKSFVHAFDPLEHRCVRVLDLTPDFDGRFIRDEAAWSKDLYPRLSNFLVEAAQSGDILRLAMDTHATLAFAAGTVLDMKSGRRVEFEQRSPARNFWAADDRSPDPSWAGLDTEVIEINPDELEIAIAGAITHDIAAEVRAYAKRELPRVGKIIVCRPHRGSGGQSIACGRHAADLAASIVAAARVAIGGGPEALVHLFLAAPNSLTFLLGQRRRMLGPTILYEYDFEGTAHRSYRPSLHLPVPV